MHVTRSRLGAKPLANAGIAALGAGAGLPSYDRSSLVPAIVHFGVGGFHRAHQAVYLDDLAHDGDGWGVVGVGLRSDRMKRALRPQDCLYTVLERDAHEDRARVVGSISRYLYGPDDPEAVLSALSDPRTRMVTLTVTGDGYCFDHAAGELDLGDPDLSHDLRQPRDPRTVVGYLVEGLRRRRAAGLAPFTVVSCDNVPSNGAVTRSAVVSLAEMRDPSLARWIDAEAAFPATVVDRITPQTTPDVRRLLADEFGIRDRWPVVAEPFAQWIVEDSFSNGRPPLEHAGVQFVGDVAQYELVKKRLLNGSHCAIGYLGYLAGLRTTDAAMRDPVLSRYAEALMEQELTALVPEMPGLDLADYKRTLLERFANPKIADPLQRLCGRGSTKMPAYLLPSLAEALERGLPHERLTLAVAAWFLYMRGVDLDGEAIEVVDPRRTTLQPLARRGDPRALLAERSVFGELGRDEAFVRELETAMRVLEHVGAARAMQALEHGEPAPGFGARAGAGALAPA